MPRFIRDDHVEGSPQTDNARKWRKQEEWIIHKHTEWFRTRRLRAESARMVVASDASVIGRRRIGNTDAPAVDVAGDVNLERS